MTHGCLAVAVTCTVLSGCSLTDAEQRCKEQSSLGLQYFQAQNFSEAEKAYRDAAETAKTSANSLQYPLMLRELVRCLQAEHKYAEAENALQLALTAYAGLAKKGSHFDNSSLAERRYETLAVLADCYMAEGKFEAARDTLAQAIALSKSIVEPLTLSADVNENYIIALKECGQEDRAANLQRQNAAAACTLEEFDQRLTKVETNLVSAKFAGAQEELDQLHLASQGFVGLNPREGRILTFLALMKLAHNEPIEAEKMLRDGLRNSNETQDPIADRSADWAMIGISRELQGDTTSSIKPFRKAFQLQPFHPIEILSIVAAGLKENGFVSQATTVRNRINWYRTDRIFTLKPTTSIEFAQLANEQDRRGQTELAEQTRLKGLHYLEKNKNLSSSAELRGAYQLYKNYRSKEKALLAARALQQMQLIGNTSPERKKQLEQALRQSGVALQ